jgi:ATP-dependent RNA helicase DDX19/DBP5
MNDDISGLISNDFQVEVKLADQQADPNSPLYSVSSFEELPLHPDLLKGIYAAGFKKPSKIQEKALPMLLANPATNLIGQSQSGTGKTAAFSLNMLSRVDPAVMTPQAICLAPSRELARQIKSVIDTLGQETSIKTFLAVPKSWRRGNRLTEQILVGTPGTLVDMIGSRVFDPKQIRVFVLDEADEMIQLQGLGDQTFRIKKVLPPEIQNVLFSATFPDEVQEFAQLFAPNANQIFLKKEDITVDAITQLKLECDNEQAKFDALSALYDVMSIGQSIVFCKRKVTADEITQRLVSEGHSVASLHGDKDHQERDKVLDGFRDGKTKVLITTNVVARGIDIQQVNMVVNYDVPDMGPEGNWEPDIETYIHRIGRTGRFGRKGLAVTFVHDDRSRRDVDTIQQRLGKPLKRIRVDKDLDQLEKALKAATKAPPASS